MNDKVVKVLPRTHPKLVEPRLAAIAAAEAAGRVPRHPGAVEFFKARLTLNRGKK